MVLPHRVSVLFLPCLQCIIKTYHARYPTPPAQRMTASTMPNMAPPERSSSLLSRTTFDRGICVIAPVLSVPWQYRPSRRPGGTGVSTSNPLGGHVKTLPCSLDKISQVYLSVDCLTTCSRVVYRYTYDGLHIYGILIYEASCLVI